MEQVQGDHLSTDEVIAALAQLGTADLVRLERLARRYGYGEVDWEELLNTAFERVIGGSRKWPRGLPWRAFLPGVLRSIAGEFRNKAKPRASTDILATVLQGDDELGRDILESIPSADPPPEEILAARETLAEIEHMFDDDEHGLAVVLAKADGLSPIEAQAMFGMTATEYDSAMKRVRRAFLKRGWVGHQT